MTDLDELSQTILEKRPASLARLVLANRGTKEYTVVTLPAGWKLTRAKPFTLAIRWKFSFATKFRVGICPEESEDETRAS